jgi:integrase
VEAIRSLLESESPRLSLRDKAIGKLLLITGIRACDIAGMRLGHIDWETDEIRLPQQKTGQPLVIPLKASIGNPIYDYLIGERPGSGSDRVFLSSNHPHYPLKAGAVWHISAKIYKFAGVRQNKGNRRGTHLFRHNVATAMLGNGIQRPVASCMLGHASPDSLDAYIHADLVHLKECALGIGDFPATEEVFRL